MAKTGGSTRTRFLLLIAVGLAACTTSAGTSTTEAAADPTTSQSPSTTVAPPATTTTTAPLGEVVSTPDQGRIVFEIREAEGGPLIAFVYMDSEGLHEIPNDEALFGFPVWAPDDQVIFDSDRDGIPHLYRISIDDGSIVQITNPPNGQAGAGISSDGGQMVYEEWNDSTGENFGLQISAIDGADSALLTPVPEGSDGVAWGTFSPDGESVAYMNLGEEAMHALFVVDVASGETRRLTEDIFEATSPKWSPDGNSILFYTDDGPGGLWLVPEAGGELQRLTDHGPDERLFGADWSPDGTEIVFKYYEKGWDHYELHVMSADGSNERTLWIGASRQVVGDGPDWGP